MLQTKLNSGSVRLAKYIVAPKSLLWVRAMIGLLKYDIVDLPIRLKGNSKHISGNSLNPGWGVYNKDFGAASQSIASGIKLRLLRRLNFGRI